MAIHITIDANDAADAQRQMAQLLGGYEATWSRCDLKVTREVLDAVKPKTNPVVQWLKDPAQPDDAEEKLRAAGATEDFAAAQTEGKKRGRKPGSKNAPKSESEAAPSASETSAAEASPAPEKTAAVADAGSPPADATADLSFEEFKKRLNDLQGVNGDNLRHITAALNALGYAKVKEVKPEDYQAVLAKCDELTETK